MGVAEVGSATGTFHGEASHMRSVSSGLIAVAVGAAVLAPVAARADVITTFDLSGTAHNVSGMTLGSCVVNASCAFSGTLTVDVTSGAVTAIDVTFPGLSAFDTLVDSGPFSTSDWLVGADNSSSDTMNLE
jgi:hypothetical protein